MVLTAQPEDLKPSIGVRDSSGVYYFTIKYGNNDPQWIVDDEGNVPTSIKVLYRLSKRRNTGTFSSHHSIK